jgi:hypothetical protein
MLGLLFGVLAIGAIIMACLFFYWLKYIYVEKEEKDQRRPYSPLSQNINETNNNNNKNFFKVNPDFIKKINERKNKKI